MGDQRDEITSSQGNSEDALRAFRQVDPEPTDPRANEAALRRLRDAPDEELVRMSRSPWNLVAVRE
jgi:hypothetical protein